MATAKEKKEEVKASLKILRSELRKMHLGVTEELSLPDSAEGGEPARCRPIGVAIGPGWAPTVSPEDAGPELGDFYDHGHQYIRRSLTLVPDELNRFWRLMNSLYMANPAVNELEGVERSISRAQIEFIATRVSAHLDCFY